MVSSCGNNAILKQVTEVVLFNELSPELNTKDEWKNSNTLREKDCIRLDDLPNLLEEDIIRTSKSNTAP